MTNFATYIDSANDRAPIAQRGKAKQKRTDLRLVGLALVVTRDGGDPAGVPRLPRRPARRHPVRHRDRRAWCARYRQLAGTVESLTVVYDAGQNSAGNHEHGRAAGIGFVGSLPP